jgi:hypothetical protein
VRLSVLPNRAAACRALTRFSLPTSSHRRSESDTDGDHYFGDEEGDTTDSLPEDEVDEAIKRSLLEEEDAVPTPPSLALSASLVRQLASTGSDTYSSPSLVSPALSASKPVSLVQPVSSAIASPMEVAGDPSPPLPRPIARSPSIVSEAATVSSAGDASRPRPAPVLAALRKAPSAPPTMGCFIPAPSPARFKSVIIDGAGDREGGAPPPTPFARRKSAEKNGARSRGQSLSLKTGSTGRKRDRHNKVRRASKTDACRPVADLTSLSASDSGQASLRAQDEANAVRLDDARADVASSTAARGDALVARRRACLT